MKTNAFIAGKKVILRTLCLKDAQGPYLAWFNDEEVCRYNRHHAFAYYQHQAENYIRKSADSRNELVLAIVAKNGKNHIGNIALQKIDFLSRNAEFSIIIGDKNYWGKGYAREAAQLLIGHGFSQLNLHRIYCATTADNLAMQKLAFSVGMKKEGCRRQAALKSGRYIDVLEYGLLKGWLK